MLFELLRPAIFALEPETAHKLAIAALRAAPLGVLGVDGRMQGKKDEPQGPLACEVAGLRFPNPVGVAAGFDKDAKVADALLGLGFGFVEVGSITPRAQAGNPRPRLFRLPEDQAVINRMGFNNEGADAAIARLRQRQGKDGIVGVNIGANKDSPDRKADYALMARKMAPLASYLAVNVSSPNTPGLRALQDESELGALLDAVIIARDEGLDDAISQGAGSGARRVPIFLKLAPDLASADIDRIAKIAIDRRIDALIIANTTLSRPPLRSRHAGEQGGLSGAPLRPLALESLRAFRKATGGQIPLIGTGGISSARDAFERIRAGASLVQLYSAMVYHGPLLGARIARGLEKELRAHGFGSIAEAVGSE